MSASSFSLEQKVALVTGAGTGIGRSTAMAFAEAGASSLYLCGRRGEVLENAKRDIVKLHAKCEVIAIPCDVTSPKDRARALSAVEKRSGFLDVLVHNAGLFEGVTLEETTDEVCRAAHAVNVEAPLAWTRDALPFLSSSASVIAISSTLAVKPISVASAYSAAKAGLVQMTRSLALELGPRGIRVNCIMPAIVDTPMYRSRFADDDAYALGLANAGKLHPIGRIGTPEDVARAALFLASPAASWITGVALPVDGGMLCT